MTLEDKQQEIIEAFSVFDDWMDKYQYIIDLGKDLDSMKESEKTEDKLIHGCTSKVWLDFKIINDEMIFSADSDADIPKGIISMLIQVLNHEKPAIIATADLHFIKDIGLQEHLFPTRANGLANMVKKMKMSALKALTN